MGLFQHPIIPLDYSSREMLEGGSNASEEEGIKYCCTLTIYFFYYYLYPRDIFCRIIPCYSLNETAECNIIIINVILSA